MRSDNPYDRSDDNRRRAYGGRDDAPRPGPFDERLDSDPFEWDEVTAPRTQPNTPLRGGRGHDAPCAAAGPGAASDVDVEWERWLPPSGPHGPETLEPAAAEARPRPPARRRPRRGLATAGAALAAMLLGFFLGGLLDADGIIADVKGRPLGTARSIQLALLRPVEGLSGALRLDRPGAALNRLLGRDGGGHHSLAEASSAQKPLWPRAITRAKPLRLYVAGDSMAQVFGSSVVNVAEATGLAKGKLDYHVSSGLSRPDYYDWPQRLIDQIVDYKPDAAVMLFGANDGQNVLYQGRVLKVGSKEWQEVYAKRVGEAMRILTRGGRRVYWVGNPIMRDFGYRKRIAMMNHIYEAEAKKHPGVFFVSTWTALANDKGAYAEYLRDDSGDLVLMRAPDGIHLTRAGGDRMAKVVLDTVYRDWRMSTVASPGAP